MAGVRLDVPDKLKQRVEKQAESLTVSQAALWRMAMKHFLKERERDE